MFIGLLSDNAAGDSSKDLQLSLFDDSDYVPRAARGIRRRLRGAASLVKDRLNWRMTRDRFARFTVVSQFFPPDFAATGQLLDDLSVRLAKKGLQVQVLTGQPAYAYNESAADRIVFDLNRCIRRTRMSRLVPQKLRGRAINGVLFCGRVAMRLVRYTRRGDLILYTTEPAYLPVLGWMMHLVTRTPYVVLFYDLYPDVLFRLGVLPRDHWVCRLWETLNAKVCASAQSVIVLSEPIAERVCQMAPEARSKIEVIPSWANPEVIQPRPKNVNRFAVANGLTKSFTVMYSGNQGRCHDLDTLLAAAKLLRDERDIKFVLIGKGALNQHLREIVSEWNLTNCRFLPYQDPDVLPESLTAADIAVVSVGSQSESLVAPCKLYGHLAAGTPIAAISPADSYLAQLVEREGCGRWFANGNAEALADWIRDLRDHPELVQSYGQSSRDLLMRTATPDLVVDKYWSVIKPNLPAGKLLDSPTNNSAGSLIPNWSLINPPAFADAITSA
jgi:glycosyltransferase involved in cell wall biosynthesis